MTRRTSDPTPTPTPTAKPTPGPKPATRPRRTPRPAEDPGAIRDDRDRLRVEVEGLEARRDVVVGERDRYAKESREVQDLLARSERGRYEEAHLREQAEAARDAVIAERDALLVERSDLGRRLREAEEAVPALRIEASNHESTRKIAEANRVAVDRLRERYNTALRERDVIRSRFAEVMRERDEAVEGAGVVADERDEAMKGLAEALRDVAEAREEVMATRVALKLANRGRAELAEALRRAKSAEMAENGPKSAENGPKSAENGPRWSKSPPPPPTDTGRIWEAIGRLQTRLEFLS